MRIQIHGEYKFSLSPNEQSAFKGWGTQLYNVSTLCLCRIILLLCLTHKLQMVRDQVGRNWWKIAIPLVPTYLLYGNFASLLPSHLCILKLNYLQTGPSKSTIWLIGKTRQTTRTRSECNRLGIYVRSR